MPAPGFDVSNAGAAIGFAAVGGLFNALLWPLLLRVALPLTVLTLGIGALVLNGLVTLLAAAVAPGVELDGLGSASVLCVVLAAVVTAWSALLALDDDARVLRPALRRAQRAGPRDAAALPGVLFVEIDGLALSVLRRAVRDGNAPALTRWLHEGTHRLHGWETDWSSQTGACQAGILHGNNHEMPAFRWWEKERGAAIVTNHPRDAAEFERRVSDGRGLLHADRASRADILSGDAPHSLLTMSTVLDRSRPGVYATFLAYDEVAHHSGLERQDTLATLRRVDRVIARIATVAAVARRPYELVVLSDHGQTQGATFLQRYGEPLDALVARVCKADPRAVAASASGEDEACGRLGAALTEAAAGDGAGAHALRTATRGRTVDGEVRVDGRAAVAGEAEPLPGIAVMASGCLGLISFPRLPGRVMREEIDERWPSLLPALREHAGIGFVLVRSREQGPVVLGARGEHRLQTGEVLGDDPLAPFGPRAARHVGRTDTFEHCPDLLVNSTWWPDTEEVAAFEELVGSHGGLGGPQAQPFVMVPSEWPWPAEDVVGAEAVHRVLRGWLACLGHESYAEGVEA